MSSLEMKIMYVYMTLKHKFVQGTTKLRCDLIECFVFTFITRKYNKYIKNHVFKRHLSYFTPQIPYRVKASLCAMNFH